MEDNDPANRIITLIREATQQAASTPSGFSAANIIVVVGDGNVVAPGAHSAAIFNGSVAREGPQTMQELQGLVDDWVEAHNGAGGHPELTTPSAWAQLGDAIGLEPSYTLPASRHSLARSWLKRQRDAAISRR